MSDDQDISMLLGQLVEATSSTSESLRALTQDSKKQDSTIAQCITTLNRIETVTDDLVKIVHRGNGAPSLTSQINDLKHEIEIIQKKMTVDETHFIEFLQKEEDDKKAKEKQKFMTGLSEKKFKWAFYACIASGVFSIIATILGVALNYFLFSSPT